MKKLKLALCVPFILVTAVWFMTNTLLYIPFDANLFTKSLDQYTGIIAFTAMTFAMVLATRPTWLEKRLDGLDKIYRLHKWLGIVAFSFSIMHWLVAKLPDWVSELDRRIILDAIAGATEIVDPDAFEKFLDTLEFPGIQVGLYAFYLTVLLLVMALLKKIPYHIFAKTHIFMAVLYLALVFHAFALMYIAYWTQPIGMVVASLMIAGTVSSLMILSGQMGKRRKAVGHIQSINTYPEMGMLELVIQSDQWKGHQEGQFAFLKFEKKERPHPFTISSAWDKSTQQIRFTIKALGDYTSTLVDRLNIGDSVRLEGAYGNFTFNNNEEGQIWIAGGVGVTPFLARMERLGQLRHTQNIDFFYAAEKMDSNFKEKLQRLSAAANITLHLVETCHSARLSGENIRDSVSNWKSKSVWFCGPARMGVAIKKDLKDGGLVSSFHQELFEMR